MEAASSFVALVRSYKTPRCHISEYDGIYIHRCEYIKCKGGGEYYIYIYVYM